MAGSDAGQRLEAVPTAGTGCDFAVSNRPAVSTPATATRRCRCQSLTTSGMIYDHVSVSMRTNMQENTMTSVHAKQEALIDELLKDYTDPRDILGEHGLLKQLTKRVVERVLEAELTAHLGYAPHVRHATEEQNARNGKGQKT